MRRVRYEANVYIRGPRQDRAVVARAHNLSAEGIAVSALELPAEGEEVECRLILGGRRTRLRGRVAWVHRSPPAHRTLPLGGGIQFISLDGSERALLNRLVDSASDGPQLCQVWVPGLDQPLPMRGLIGTDEVKLGMRLPQLSVGMPVRISFVHRGVSESRQGKIDAVRFLPGDRNTMSRVALQVSTPRPRQGAGLIRNELASGQAPDETAPGTQSMLVDLAVLSLQAGMGGPPPPPGFEGYPPGPMGPMGPMAQPPAHGMGGMPSAPFGMAPSAGLGMPPPHDDQTPIIPYDPPYDPPPIPQHHQPPTGGLHDRRIRWALPAAVAVAGALVVGVFLSTSETKPPPAAVRPAPPPPPAPRAPPPRPASFTPPASIQPIPAKAAAAAAAAAKAARKKARAAKARAARAR